MKEGLRNKLKETQVLIDKRLEELVFAGEGKLVKAMRYMLFGGGKRLRPFLIVETAKLFGVENEDVITAGCAIELLHTFSLIHDDLPAMDNDDFRRGKPSCHKKFDEETAILAGDALCVLSFELLSSHLKNTSAEKRCELIGILSKASGWRGMCLGQSMDMIFEKSGSLKSSDEAEKINKLKTGALFRACVEIGCVLGDADENDRKVMIEFSENFGQAFQLRDDIEDDEIDEASIDRIKEKIQKLVKKNKEILAKFDKTRMEGLLELNKFCIN